MFRSFTAKIFAVSVVALYLEMVFIRLLAAEIRLLAYTSNFVLVVCFFSLGYGFLRQQAPGKALWRSGMASAALFLFPYLPEALGPLHPRLLTSYLSRFQDFVIWFQEPSAEFAEAAREIALGLVILLVLCFLLLTVLAPLGSILGQLFARSDRPKLTSYSANIVGSIGGIVLFSLVSWLWLKPYWWAAVLAGMFLLMVLQFREPGTAEERSPRRRWLPALIAVFSVLIALLVTARLWEQNHASSTIWSSYHRVDIAPLYEYEELQEHYLKISVNSAFIMGIYNLSPEFLARAPQFAQRARQRPAHFD